jgi:hypothetical protein
MSDPAEVAGGVATADRASEAVRFRPPSPLPPRRRAVIVVVVVALALVGGALVLHARSADGDLVPAAAWRSLPVPRAARIDPFDRRGALGEVDGFGRWQTSGSLEVDGITLRSPGGGGVATVDARSADVLVHAQVMRMGTGSGLVLSAAAPGVPGLLLQATGPDRWELSWQRSGVGPEVIQSFEAPTEYVPVQVVRRGDRLKVTFDDQAYDVDVPGETGGTFVGVAVAGPGTELDLFGYLPLDA